MTDKEQIMIDGVDVSGCKEYIWALSHVCNLVNGRTDKFECNYYPNCYFKQLARKTQEYEGLKKQLETAEEWRIKAESLNEKLELRNTCYRKALEEIEKVCIEDTRTFADGTTVRYDALDEILDIINKAKGEGMEIT